MSMYLEESREASIQILRMNRPEKKNALSGEMYLAIAAALHAAQSDNTIRVTVITGTGDSFTAGNDLSDFSRTPGAPKDEKTPAPFPTFLSTLMMAQKPVIAAVNGLAVGIGTTMLPHCDLVYAADTARFSMPFVNLGAVPEAGSTQIMPQIMGRLRAMELFLLGEPFSAQHAFDVGIVNRVFPAAQLMQEVMAIANRVALKAPSALRETKRLVREHSLALEAAIREEGRTFAAQLRTPESKEALKAFAERRPADFSKFD